MMKKAKKDSELKIPAAIFNIFYPMDSRKRFYNPRWQTWPNHQNLKPELLHIVKADRL